MAEAPAIDALIETSLDAPAFPRLGSEACRAYIAALPYYHRLLPDGRRLVPKEPIENARWRRDLLGRAERNPAFQDTLRRMCEQDLLFFANFVCWSVDPGRSSQGLPVEFPLVTWDFQDDDMVEVELAISGGYWLPSIKSREMGGSWNRLIVMYWRWLFRRRQMFTLLSAKEDKVDARDNPDTLFGKLDILWEHTPSWLRPANLIPAIHRTHMHFYNPQTKSVFDGDSAGQDAGRGGRRTAILGDEWASLPDQKAILASIGRNSKCLLPLSTPKSPVDEFARMVGDPRMRVLRLGWYYRPDYRAGLYTSVDGVFKPLDPGFVYPAGFVPICDGHLRSPWHDADEAKLGPTLHAQETDMNVAGSVPRLFDQQTVDRLRALYCREPVLSLPLRTLFKPPDEPQWQAFWSRVGSPMVHFWVPLQQAGSSWLAPADRRYGFGVDVSTGTGASNSVIHVADTKEMRQAAEFSSPHVLPEELAHVCVALGKVFRGTDESFPQANWEEKGVGRAFSTKLKDLGWRHWYWHTPETTRKRKQGPAPGWNPTPENQTKLLVALRDAMNTGSYKVLSGDAVTECGHYQYDGNTVKHSAEANMEDPSGAGSNHGDRCFAAGLAHFPVRAYTRLSEDAESSEEDWRPDPPEGSPAWRRQQWDDERRRQTAPLGDW
jgi:hypothetical protein